MVFIIEKLQDILSYEGCTNFQFRGNGIGKIGTSGFLLGFVGAFIINHSAAYSMAALASWVEFWLECYMFGSAKLNYYSIAVGLILVISGQIIRSLAMWTCGPHFSHIIMEEKTKQHCLVTTGIYSVLRHPAYFGWFYWSIGTQLLLCNPICTIAYGMLSLLFFKKRIPYEENLLVDFYPTIYPAYSKRTFIGIPFVSGVIFHEKES